MFVNQSVLPHPLEPESYRGAAFFDREMETLFRTHWHLVGLAADLARAGDYIACAVLGTPMLVRNVDGKVRAFRNVCAHRGSLLALPGSGHSEKFRCRYHGWEYDTDGKVVRIPDVSSFKGIRLPAHHLAGYRVELFGPFVFVNLSPGDDTVRDLFGPLLPDIERFFLHHRLAWVKATEHPVNWKIICENAVESYHVPMIHPTTFKDFRPSELHDHRLEAGYTSYLDLLPWGKSLVGRGMTLWTRLAHQDADARRFTHTHIFPNLLLLYGDTFSDFAVVEPIGPTRSRHVQYALVPARLKWSLATRPLQSAYVRLLERMNLKIFQEDQGAWLGAQAGLPNSTGPRALGAREERVWAFQHWVCEGTRTAETPKQPG